MTSVAPKMYYLDYLVVTINVIATWYRIRKKSVISIILFPTRTVLLHINANNSSRFTKVNSIKINFIGLLKPSLQYFTSIELSILVNWESELY